MIVKNKLKTFLKATVMLAVAFSYAQTDGLRKLEQYVWQKDIGSANTALSSIDQKSLKPAALARLRYLQANLALLDNRDNLAFDYYIIAKKQYAAIDSLDQVAQINMELVSLLVALSKTDVDYNPYLDEYLAYARQKKNPGYLSKAYMQSGKSFYDSDPEKALGFFKEALRENLKTNDLTYTARIYQNIGATYACDRISKLDSALYVYEKALRIFKQQNLPDYLFYIYTNKGVAYTKKKQFDKALANFTIADSLAQDLKEYNAKNKEALYGYMAGAYKEKGDYKNALEYLDRQQVYREILNENEQKKAIREIDTRYKTKEKELENLALKSNIKTSRIISYSTAGLLLVLAIISVLGYKNITKKKKIAEQEKLIETQKLEKALKEHELHEIDLMLESQEKERQRIANELHDNLGSMLATLKLNFEHLRNRNGNIGSEETAMFNKTDGLIEEAYQEVRNISHLKNLGVIGSQGLLIAVRKMAEKMSILEKLHINVIPFGLTERLDNTVEVTLFRIIQELCTNIIKHSKATEVNIYLTQRSSSEINIIIEDNGKGFFPNKITDHEGIGLKSIEKKTEQLGGTFTIDSIISRGTNIIIDLPL